METRDFKVSEVKEIPEMPEVVLVEAVFMPNGEIISFGKTCRIVNQSDEIKRVYKVEEVK